MHSHDCDARAHSVHLMKFTERLRPLRRHRGPPRLLPHKIGCRGSIPIPHGHAHSTLYAVSSARVRFRLCVESNKNVLRGRDCLKNPRSLRAARGRRISREAEEGEEDLKSLVQRDCLSVYLYFSTDDCDLNCHVIVCCSMQIFLSRLSQNSITARDLHQRWISKVCDRASCKVIVLLRDHTRHIHKHPPVRCNCPSSSPVPVSPGVWKAEKPGHFLTFF